MRAGKLDRRIEIQRKVVTPSESGELVETWTTLAANRPASVSPVSGDERFNDPQVVGKQQVEFRVRWAEVLSDLNPLDRILYPLTALPLITVEFADIDVDSPVGTVVGVVTLTGPYTGTPLWSIEGNIDHVENTDYQSYYDILSVSEIGRREGLRILAAKRSDVAPIVVNNA